MYVMSGTFNKITVKKAGTSGFTLLEVMIAMAVLAVTMAAVFQSQSQSISMITGSRFETTAAFLAKLKMAELEAVAAGELSSGNGDFGDDFKEYVWEAEVEDTELEYVVKIVLVVRNERMAKNNTYRLELYRSTVS
ncbi:MAG: prepilin-type N-terminal cleavage/methylation domain-containing protein [Syntrophales bacterium]|jgi:general secretion pathway protein I|nr:prepilin-type N-terminal cleavage/methylation domain-containing protein [Syntrophales bacterium]